MECPICYTIIYTSYVTTCTHHFCKSCILRWCKNNSSCPKCRQFIYDLKEDKEFDTINSNFNSNSIINNDLSNNNLTPCYILPALTPENKIGITLTNNPKGPGVKIVNIDPYGRAAKSGLAKNSIILFVNNLPCINHQQVIQIIEFFKASNSPFTLYILN